MQQKEHMMKRLLGRVVLVTGGGSGIGRAAAMAYGREGAQVVIAGRRAAGIEETAALIVASGGVASACAADVSSGPDVKELVGVVRSRYGRLDIAFNNAGTEGKFAPSLT